MWRNQMLVYIISGCSVITFFIFILIHICFEVIIQFNWYVLLYMISRHHIYIINVSIYNVWCLHCLLIYDAKDMFILNVVFLYLCLRQFWFWILDSSRVYIHIYMMWRNHMIVYMMSGVYRCLLIYDGTLIHVCF